MSGYTFFGNGAYSSNIVGGNMTPALPASVPSGALMLLSTGVNSASIGVPTISGWTMLSPNTNAKGKAIFARVATVSESSPVFQWDASHQAYANIIAFTGDVYTDLSTIVDISSDRGTNTTGRACVQSTAAPGTANCLAIRASHCNKTSTNNGSSFLDWITDASIYTLAGGVQLVQNNSALAAGIWYAQQTAATATATDTAPLTNTDTSSNSQGVTLLLKSLAPIIAPPTSGGIFVCP